MQLGFVDFWPEFDPLFLFFVRALCDKYGAKIVCDVSTADVIFCSVFGSTYMQYPNKFKVLVSGENMNFRSVNYNDFNYCILTNSNVPNTYYLPYAAIAYDLPTQTKQYMKPKTKFCCFCVSSELPWFFDGNIYRNWFFDKLCEYKRVDSVGAVKNNVGYLQPKENFENFVADYKFMICFENSWAAGYFTEKAARCLVAGVIPIYWGSEAYIDSCIMFNPADPESTLKEIIHLDINDEAYAARLESLALAQTAHSLFSRSACIASLHSAISNVCV